MQDLAAPITEDEVRRHVARWFELVASDAPVEEQQELFAPGVAIRAGDDRVFPLPEHRELHQRFRDEVHERLENLSLKEEEPAEGRARAHAEASVHWEATRVDTGGRIRATVWERWALERRPDGEGLRFASYHSWKFDYSPGSAPLFDD